MKRRVVDPRLLEARRGDAAVDRRRLAAGITERLAVNRLRIGRPQKPTTPVAVLHVSSSAAAQDGLTGPQPYEPAIGPSASTVQPRPLVTVAQSRRAMG